MIKLQTGLWKVAGERFPHSRFISGRGSLHPDNFLIGKVLLSGTFFLIHLQEAKHSRAIVQEAKQSSTEAHSKSSRPYTSWDSPFL